MKADAGVAWPVPPTDIRRLSLAEAFRDPIKLAQVSRIVGIVRLP